MVDHKASLKRAGCRPPAHSPSERRRAGSAMLQPILAGVVLIVLIAVGLAVFNNIMNKKKEQRFHREVMVGYKTAASPAEKIRTLNTYLDRYPRGMHAPEIAALVDKADRERGLDLLLDASVVFHNRKTAPLTGRVQLLKTNQMYTDLLAAMDKNNKIKKLKQAAESDDAARLDLFDAVGVYLQKLKVQVVAEAEVDKGKVRFTHLKPGEYLLYGVANSGSNIIGIFDGVDVQEGEGGEMSIASYSAYARDAERRAERWKM